MTRIVPLESLQILTRMPASVADLQAVTAQVGFAMEEIVKRGEPRHNTTFDEHLARLERALPGVSNAYVNDMRVLYGDAFYGRQTSAVSTNSNIVNEVDVLYFCARWYEAGLPVFRLTADLLAGLIMTDISKVPIEDIKFPFPAFVVELPANFWSCVMLSGKRAEALYLTCLDDFYRLDDTERPPRIYAAMYCNTGGPAAPVYAMRTEVERAGYYRPNEGEIHASSVAKEANRAIMTRLPGVLLNLCLYVAEQQLGNPQIQRLMRYTNKQKKYSPLPVTRRTWLLGKEVKLRQNLIEDAKACISARVGWKVKTRFTVRGHWRNQACGKNLQDRKRIWIRPYWKGPEEAMRVAHLYTAEEKKRT